MMNSLTYSTEHIFLIWRSVLCQKHHMTCKPEVISAMVAVRVILAVPRAHPATRTLSLGLQRDCKGCVATLGASEGASRDRKHFRLQKRSKQNTTPRQHWHRILHRARNTNRHRERNKTKNRRCDSPRCAHGVATGCLAKKSQRLPSIRRGLQFLKLLELKSYRKKAKTR